LIKLRSFCGRYSGYLNADMCKSELSQKEESRVQSINFWNVTENIELLIVALESRHQFLN